MRPGPQRHGPEGPDDLFLAAGRQRGSSVRPRSRRITTELRESPVRAGSADSKTGAAAKNRLPYGWKATTSPAGS
jgi:hypothetical protein